MMPVAAVVRCRYYRRMLGHDESPRSKAPLSGLRRRTVVGLLRRWREVAGSARHALGADVRPSLPKEDVESLREQMQQCLDSPGGEISERARTAELGRTYLQLNETGKMRFLKLLASDFDVNPVALERAIGAYQSARGPGDKRDAEQALRQALETSRSKILRQFTALPDGFKFLVDMRADVLPLAGKDSTLKGLEYDLKQILAAWFDIALLDLAELTWNSPAALLEKLIEYEAVHRIRSWEDLKNRLDADRRVYAFFHNKMPYEPLIFLHVALTRGMSGNIGHLLDEAAPKIEPVEADTAVFYSISNAQRGLTGISFGNFLIKRVVGLLMEQLPQLKTFATLSPVPGFRQWLEPLLVRRDTALFEPVEETAIKAISGRRNAADGLQALLAGEWSHEKSQAETLKPVLMRLCARYLLEEKKNGRPLDAVANFHLSNGARLERLNWLADASPKGMQQSAGMMVNYYYKLADIDENHEAFSADGKIVASRQVRGYLA